MAMDDGRHATLHLDEDVACRSDEHRLLVLFLLSAHADIACDTARYRHKAQRTVIRAGDLGVGMRPEVGVGMCAIR